MCAARREILLEIDGNTLAQRVAHSKSKLAVTLPLLRCLTIPLHGLLIVRFTLQASGKNVS